MGRRGLHSQHSGARRADEAAHGDVGVSHPGLVALEAVFVYSRLGQLPDLAGADLLVVPVLTVRHFFFKLFWSPPVTQASPPPRLTLLGPPPGSPPFTPRSTSRPHYGNAFMRLHPKRKAAQTRGASSRERPTCSTAEAARLSFQNKSDREGTVQSDCDIFTFWLPVSLKNLFQHNHLVISSAVL